MNMLLSRLDEQQRRWYAALEATRLGHGGDQLVGMRRVALTLSTSRHLSHPSERHKRTDQRRLGVATAQSLFHNA